LLDNAEIKEAESIIKEYVKTLKSSNANTNMASTQPANAVKTQTLLQGNVVDKINIPSPCIN
jgi:hypothetical protein